MSTRWEVSWMECRECGESSIPPALPKPCVKQWPTRFGILRPVEEIDHDVLCQQSVAADHPGGTAPGLPGPRRSGGRVAARGADEGGAVAGRPSRIRICRDAPSG